MGFGDKLDKRLESSLKKLQKNGKFELVIRWGAIADVYYNHRLAVSFIAGLVEPGENHDPYTIWTEPFMKDLRPSIELARDLGYQLFAIMPD